jgi:hypothetical protein
MEAMAIGIAESVRALAWRAEPEVEGSVVAGFRSGAGT